MDMAKAEILKAASDKLNERLSYNCLRFDSTPASHDSSPYKKVQLADEAHHSKAQVINPESHCDREIDHRHLERELKRED